MTPSTKPGQHGTLYRYRIDYTPDPTPGATTRMNAMMSDRTSRERATMPGPDPGFTMNCAAYVAEAEARRILAVAEPPEARRLERVDYADGRSCWYEADEADDREERCWPAPLGIRRPLIESLAAFLSAPDPAEYLASLA